MRRTKLVYILLPLCAALILSSCCLVKPGPKRNIEQELEVLKYKYQLISQNISQFDPGGKVVLDVAYGALAGGKAEGKWSLVSIEDLWAHAIKEGSVLFNKPDKRWGRTTAVETHDMLGQTTIGPWQITIQNVKNIYGPPYGVSPDWTNTEVYDYCRDHPDIQAKMIADYIQKSYDDYGLRSPYAIQRYFWLEAYAKGEIGQGPWDVSVLAVPPSGNWKDITPEMLRNTGFYAKQLVLGSKHNSYGLMYWLYITGDIEAMKDVIKVWKNQKHHVWRKDKAVPTKEPGNFAIKPEELKYCSFDPEFEQTLLSLLEEP